MERLQKALARTGVASRRKAEELITGGRVNVNGKTVSQLGAKVDPESDIIEVDGVRLKFSAPRNYLMLNKPANTVTTRSDPQGRKTVMDLLPPGLRHLHPVGRLDNATEGLLLFTDDGSFTHRLTHPRHEIAKTYHALVQGRVGKEALRQLERGIVLEDGMTAPAKVRLIQQDDGNSEVEITIHEGRKRQVRRMFDAMGHHVLKLKRVQIGDLKLGTLPPGRYRRLTPSEVEHLLRTA